MWQLLIIDLKSVLYTGAGFPNFLSFEPVEIDGLWVREEINAGGSSLLFSLLYKYRELGEVLICTDSKTNFRNEIYSYYKVTRKTASKNQSRLVHQEEPLAESLLGLVGIDIHKMEGYEADDLIGTAVDRYKNTVDHITILSDDSDLNVLLGPNVSIQRVRKGRGLKVYDSKENTEYTSLDKAINGDRSDDIPRLYLNPEAIQMLFSITKSAVTNKDTVKLLLKAWGLSNNHDLIRNIDLAYIDKKVPLEFYPTALDNMKLAIIRRVISELRGNEGGLLENEVKQIKSKLKNK